MTWWMKQTLYLLINTATVFSGKPFYSIILQCCFERNCNWTQQAITMTSKEAISPIRSNFQLCVVHLTKGRGQRLSRRSLSHKPFLFSIMMTALRIFYLYDDSAYTNETVFVFWNCGTKYSMVGLNTNNMITSRRKVTQCMNHRFWRKHRL